MGAVWAAACQTRSVLMLRLNQKKTNDNNTHAVRVESSADLHTSANLCMLHAAPYSSVMDLLILGLLDVAESSTVIVQMVMFEAAQLCTGVCR